MSHAPIATSDSIINLNIGHVPNIEDPIIYEALLDIHNALEILASASFDLDSGVLAPIIAYIAARTNVTIVTADYTVLSTNGTIKIDAGSNPITVTLPTAAPITGTRYELKCIDSTFRVLIATDGIETIDEDAADFDLYQWENLTVQSDGTGWIVL